ncbi:MAG: hypothetical protein GY803_10510 [Chloroflexi bacterium]|nr:hypothetical protein [Chloroflexota bacterium]
MDWLQIAGDYLGALVDNPIVAQMVIGAVEGLVVGLLVGAIVWALMQAPDALGRAILFAIILGIVVSVWEFVRIGSVLGMSMSSILNSFDTNPAIGRLFFQAGLRTLIAMLIGAAIGVGSQVPHFMMRGGLYGIFLGALVGAALNAGLFYFGVRLHLLIFRGLISLGTWAFLAMFDGGK